MAIEREKPKKRGLGRGLGALFEDEEGLYPQAEAAGAGPAEGPKRTAGVDQLEPGPFQPRQYIAHEALSELAESIAVHGVLQPILVRPRPDDPNRYQIIAGERRWRAAQKAQLHEVPVIIREMSDEQALEIALIENLQREDLNALEEAQGYQRLMEEFGHTQEKLAAALGKSRSHIANMVRLLGLPQGVQVLIRQGKLSAGHARALITAENPEELARVIVEGGMSVREAEKLAAESSGREQRRKGRGAGAGAGKDVDTLALEREVTNRIGMKVTIDIRGGGAGVLKIEYKSLEQLDEILHRLSHYPGRQQTG